MYERFTDRALKVMQLANEEAQRFNHEYIGTEHILLGIIREGGGIAFVILGGFGVDLQKVRLEVEKLVQSASEDMATIGRLPQTPRAKRVIEFAMEEARGFDHKHIGTEHLLLGLIREAEGVGGQALLNLGLELDVVRQCVLQAIAYGEHGTVSSPIPFSARIMCCKILFEFDELISELDTEVFRSARREWITDNDVQLRWAKHEDFQPAVKVHRDTLLRLRNDTAKAIGFGPREAHSFFPRDYAVTPMGYLLPLKPM
ncbi:MAG: hypothetical protein K8Q97_03855 [Candidatus Andersenbacteria bacterium]|nr:hypothetical protein [Candidatus Andersenbacteria bacterium]